MAAHAAGCDCVQLFTKNNNQWRAKPLTSRLAVVGVFPAPRPPAELGAHLRAEMDKWGPIIKAAGITSKE